MDSNSKVRLFSDFTDTYLKWEGDIAKRALECMRIQYPLWLEPVEPDDLCAGRGEFDDELGFTPQALVNKFCYYFDEEKAEQLLADASLSDECRCRFAEIAAFWKTEDSACKLRKSYSAAVSSLLPSDDWKGEAGCAFPLYRMSGTQLDYDKLLRLGIPGLKQELSRFADERPECRKYYEDAAAELDYVTEVMRWYAGSLRGSENENLNTIAGILDALCCRAPETMREAIQLSYLYCQLAGREILEADRKKRKSVRFPSYHRRKRPQERKKCRQIRSLCHRSHSPGQMCSPSGDFAVLFGTES